MRSLALATLLAALTACTARDLPPGPAPVAPAAAPSDTTRTDWGRLFEAEDARGTLVVLDVQTGQNHVFNPERAAERFVPASTFKVYNSLVALDTGAAPDVDSVFAWDGVERSRPTLNRDHSLRSGLSDSVVWLYQRIAREVGLDGYRAAFAREPYGNRDPGETVDMFWLDGPLAISAHEQVAFLDRLRRGALAFAPEHQAAVREILLLEEGDGVRLYGKTGWFRPSWAEADEEDLGWLVGWVERDGEAWVFALNVEADGPGFSMGRARHAILYAVLDDLGLRPLDPAPGG
ncbi:MAG: penicillin-binding transpeptidase domain-containing protein [Rubricoccaceae bacterium]|nr:penicillin-binding transpeptidase domain-containing protein [Rubricoccaceae bacterium]